MSKVASATSGVYEVSPPLVCLTRRATSPLGKTTVISGGQIDVDKSFESSIWYGDGAREWVRECMVWVQECRCVGVWYLLADDASTVQVRQSPRAVVQANEVEELGG